MPVPGGEMTGLLSWDNSVPAILAFFATRGGNCTWFGPRRPKWKSAGEETRKQALEKGLTL